ncbi:hypothetical protein D9M71_352210 [compost metagenome]
MEACSASAIEATSLAVGASESKRSEVCCNAVEVVTPSTATPPGDLSIRDCCCSTSISLGSSNVAFILAAFASTTSLSLLTVISLLAEMADKSIPALPAK